MVRGILEQRRNMESNDRIWCNLCEGRKAVSRDDTVAYINKRIGIIIVLTILISGSIITNNYKTKGSSTMQNNYRFPQFNNYYVNPAYSWQLGFIADGKILHCEKLDFLLRRTVG